MKVRKSWTEEIRDPLLRAGARRMDVSARKFFAAGGTIRSGYRAPREQIAIERHLPGTSNHGAAFNYDE